MEYLVKNGDVDPRAAFIVDTLTRRGWKISFAESCTAGLAAAHLVDVPSASNVFDASFVTYSNEAKVKYLGVSADTIAEQGVVSEAVAIQMAAGTAGANGTQVGVGITGIAGPTGGTPTKPVGMVCFGFYIDGKTFSATKQFGEIGRDAVRGASVDYVYSFLMSMFTLMEKKS
ncbi:MAG: CinA family protein [Eubacteriales bacterium]|nr:CinA family protein [Eubacteriales bacterium]